MRLDVIVVLVVASAIAACAAVVERSDRAADRVGDAIQDYCESTSPEDRQALRSRINDSSDPHSVEVDCRE